MTSQTNMYKNRLIDSNILHSYAEKSVQYELDVYKSMVETDERYSPYSTTKQQFEEFQASRLSDDAPITIGNNHWYHYPERRELDNMRSSDLLMSGCYFAAPYAVKGRVTFTNEHSSFMSYNTYENEHPVQSLDGYIGGRLITRGNNTIVKQSHGFECELQYYVDHDDDLESLRIYIYFGGEYPLYFGMLPLFTNQWSSHSYRFYINNFEKTLESLSLRLAYMPVYKREDFSGKRKSFFMKMRGIDVKSLKPLQQSQRIIDQLTGNK